MEKFSFIKAKPVWQSGTETEMNCALLFSALFRPADGKAELFSAGSSSYLVFVNGKLIAHGPQRCAKGFFRCDDIALDPYLCDGVNLLEVRVSGYNLNSYSFHDQPSFLCAEILSGGEVLAYTDADSEGGFIAREFTERYKKVQRYSYQRTFAESYRLGGDEAPVFAELARTEDKVFLPRSVPYGDYNDIFPEKSLTTGNISKSKKQSYPKTSWMDIGAEGGKYKSYPLSDLEYRSYVEISDIDFKDHTPCDIKTDEIDLKKNTFLDLDMGRNYTGLVAFDIEFREDGQFFVIYDEIMNEKDINFFRYGCMAVIALNAKKGKYSFVTAEPYVFKFARLISDGADVIIKNFRFIKIAFPESKMTAKFVGDDPAMKTIFEAAKETFAANTVDIYMDCPSRERAGWLCDSWFTSRVERVMTGNSEVEKAFLTNFLLPEKHEDLPEGMLSMCYPSDHVNGSFIPNWAMWYVLELREYFRRTADRELIDLAKEKTYKLLAYFKKLENELGLLENLESWVFVEWSKCNDLTQDVNFPSNMLYASFKDALSELYGDETLKKEAKALRKTIRETAMTDSGFFCDNAKRVDGKLVLTGERTETCQYYAFFTNTATEELYPELWNRMITEFGYDRAEKGLYKDIYPSNAFIGNYLRLEIIARKGMYDKLYDDIKGYFTYMAEKTGTLWENVTTHASCNHGFASHVIYWMNLMGIVK